MANPHQQKEQHIAAFFVQKLTKVHSQVASTLAASQERYNTIQDRHHIPATFQMGDRIWLQLAKQCFKARDSTTKKENRCFMGPIQSWSI